jgi:DNA repair exonuclease SbcCD nuclease subunit
MSRHLFAHIGDTHLCPGPRQQDRINAIQQIIVWCEAASERGELAAILWPGDLFDRLSTVEDRNLLQPLVQRLAALAPVVLCDGNHDKPGDLEYLSRTASRFPIHLVSTPKTIRVHCATQIEAAVFCLPYPHKGGLVGAGVEHDDLGQVARSVLDPIFAVAAEELRQASDEGAIPLFIGHVNVGGAISSTGQPQIGREIELDPGLLARLDAAAYKGLNHIHKHQVVAGDTVYAGSICRQDFGENESKGFVVVDIRADVDSPSIETEWAFVPLDVPEQILIQGRLTRDGFLILNDSWHCESCATIDAPADRSCADCADGRSRSWAGADIKVRYHYQKSETSALDVAHIHAEFAGCRSLKLDAIAEFEHTVRAPEIASAVTLTDKAHAYCDHRQIPWTASIASKLDGLQQQEAEAILAAVQAMAAESGQVAAEPRRAVA